MEATSNNFGRLENQDYHLKEELKFNNDCEVSDTGLSTNKLEYRTSVENQEVVKVGASTNTSISAFDVAKYILLKLEEPCTTMKLHKLLYYCQAWYLVWEDKPLFKEDIEAWANGPVIRQLFSFHHGLYWINANILTIGNPSKLNKVQIEDINNVLEFYGSKTSEWLINQTHSESPWLKARKGLMSNERGNSKITLQSIFDYYSNLK